MFTMWNLPLRVMLTPMMGEPGQPSLDDFHALGKINDFGDLRRQLLAGLYCSSENIMRVQEKFT